MEYSVPSWSSQPLCNYQLLITHKDSQPTQKTLDSQECYSIGSSPKADIQLSHSSVKEFHAVLQHSDTGALYILPKGSVNLNNQPLTEKYSRVYTDDIIEFPDSNHLLALQGPLNMTRTSKPKLFDSEGKIKESEARHLRYKDRVRRVHENAQRNTEQETRMRNKLQEVTWGFSEDAEEAHIPKEDLVFYQENLDLKKVKNRKNLTSKQKSLIKLIENSNKKLNSLQNLEPTQEVKDQIEELKGEKDNNEEKLRTSFIGGDTYTYLKNEVPSDEDEYFDRTKTQTSQEPKFYYRDLQDKLNNLANERDSIVEQIQKVSQSETSTEEDPLEAFMQETVTSLKKETLEKLGSRLSELNEQIQLIQEQAPGVQPVKTSELRQGTKKRKLYQVTPKPKPRHEEENHFAEPLPHTVEYDSSLNQKYGY